MRSPVKGLIWRLGYGLCCLVYVAWVVHLSFNNFDMVHSDYCRAEVSLQPARIKALALKELVDQCHKESRGLGRLPVGDRIAVTGEDPCLSWPTAVVEKRQQAVTGRLLEQRSMVVWKLLFFYVFFVIIFLILPPLIIYLLLSFFIWLFKGVKVVK